MANLKEAFEYASQNPQSEFANNLKALASSGSLDQEAKKYGIDLSPFKPKTEEPSQMSKLGGELFKRAETIGEEALKVGEGGGSAFLPLRIAGQAAGAVGDIAAAGINTVTGGGLDKLGEYIASTETGKQLGQALSKLQQEQPELAQNLGDLFNVASLGVGGAAAKPVVKTGVEAVKKGGEVALVGAKKGIDVVKEGISPTPTLSKALEEAAVARKAKEIPAFQKAVSAVNVEGVETFADLNTRFKQAIPEIAKKVDDELVKDTTMYKIEDLLVPQLTKSGKEIKTDYITRSIDGLKDLYTKLGDDVAKADIEELEVKAKTQGLTRLDVNNLARQYNTEYGNKAFTATGDIKQGFNAEVYESTRKGLKDIARQGIGGEQAKALDESLSAIYDAQKLAERNANAVQAMKTRIEEKGWIGEGVRKAFELSDILTGGAVRAIRDTVLARGSAQKLQNVLELENKLKKNLEVINKALKAKTEGQATKILQNLPKE